MTASFTQTSQDRGVSPARAMAATAPAVAPSPATAGAGLSLSDSVLAFLAIVAAHDRTTPEEFLTRCICQRLDQIGLSRALDFVEAGRASRTPESEEGREGVPLGVLPVPRAPP